jgi:hypothetical protein
MTVPTPPWMTHADGRPMRLGEMPRDQQLALLRAACERFMRRDLPALRVAVVEMDADLPARLTAIRASYAPYDTMPAFDEGFRARAEGGFQNPYDGRKDIAGQVAAQAWDRGLEAAARYARAVAQAEGQ